MTFTNLIKADRPVDAGGVSETLLDETDVSRRSIRLVTERIQSIFPDETDEGCLYAIGEEPNLLWALKDLDIFNGEARVDIASCR